MSTAKKTKPALWKRIVSRIKSASSHGTAAGQWSGRKAQAAVKRTRKQVVVIQVQKNLVTHYLDGQNKSGVLNQARSLVKQENATCQAKQSNHYLQVNMQQPQKRNEKIKPKVNNLVNNLAKLLEKSKNIGVHNERRTTLHQVRNIIYR